MKRVGRWTRPVGNALWVSSDGSPMGYFAIADTIARRTATAFGRPINPHLFRDCAATSIAIDDPRARAHRLAASRAPIDGDHRALLQPSADDRRRATLSGLPCRASKRHDSRRQRASLRAPDARRHLCPLFDRPAVAPARSRISCGSAAPASRRKAGSLVVLQRCSIWLRLELAPASMQHCSSRRSVVGLDRTPPG